MNDLVKEIEEMSKLLDANTPAPETNAPGTSAPGTEPPGTEAPGTEAPGTEAPETEAPATAAPPGDLDEIREENRLLKERLDKLEKPPTEAPGTQAPATDAPIGDEDFVGEIDLDELTRDKGALNKVLNLIYKKGIETARVDMRTGDERVLRSVPGITKLSVEQTTVLRKASEQFYEDNEDLKPWKKQVAAVLEERAAETPEKPLSDLLKDVAPEVRKRLELQAKATKPNDKGNPPKLPKSKGKQPRRNVKPEPDKLMSGIYDMNKALES